MKHWLIVCCLTAAAFGQPYTNPISQRSGVRRTSSRGSLEEKVLQLQNCSPAIPRLDIPSYDWWNEPLHGIAGAG